MEYQVSGLLLRAAAADDLAGAAKTASKRHPISEAGAEAAEKAISHPNAPWRRRA